MLKPWIKRSGYTNRVRTIQNRQALLSYDDDNAKTLKYLKDQLRLNFGHVRQIPQTQRDLPTAIKASDLDLNKRMTEALSQYQNTDGVTDEGLTMLASKRLSKTQLRHLLGRLRYPDFPKLIDLIVRDLKERDSRGFGSMAIHKALTLEQLDDLAEKHPKVIDQTNYVNIYLTKLAPSDDVNWMADVEAHQKYLDRLWSYVNKLSPRPQFAESVCPVSQTGTGTVSRQVRQGLVQNISATSTQRQLHSSQLD